MSAPEPAWQQPGPPAFIYLASQSPRRRQLLEQIGVRHRLLLPVDAAAAEALEAVRPREAPHAYARRVTQLKLDQAVRQLQAGRLEPAPLLCADTTVALGRQVLGKPRDGEDAACMLRLLSGRTHRVISAVVLWHGDWRGEASSTSRVRFARLTDADIAGYVDSGEWDGKAGAYAIQGRAAAFIEHISGSYSGIMGLPLFETAALLRQAGVR